MIAAAQSEEGNTVLSGPSLLCYKVDTVPCLSIHLNQVTKYNSNTEVHVDTKLFRCTKGSGVVVFVVIDKMTTF